MGRRVLRNFFSSGHHTNAGMPAASSARARSAERHVPATRHPACRSVSASPREVYPRPKQNRERVVPVLGSDGGGASSAGTDADPETAARDEADAFAQRNASAAARLNLNDSSSAGAR